MRVAVVGAGIVGVTTAYELASQGHEVHVFERNASVATGCSFANAGVVAPSYVTPWAAPGMPMKVVRHLLGRHAPVRFGGANALASMPWLWRWLRACRSQPWAKNRGAMQRLAQFSQTRMLELTRRLNLEYEQMPGYLVLLRSARELAAAQLGLALLVELGIGHAVVNAARCRQLEPGLNQQQPLEAAIHLPQDGVGNCRQFAHLLKAEAQRLGAQFRFGADVRRLEPGRPVTLHAAGNASQPFDAVVVCTGVEANALLTPLGAKLPLIAVYGHSVTAPLRRVDNHPHIGPRAALMDESYKVAISRLGQRVRVAGGAQIGGRLTRIDDRPLRTLYRVLDDWFPGAALVDQAQAWKGARPMLPDGPPVLGASGAAGIWLNTGHGSSGWALACGSALVLAELIAGRPAPVEVAAFGIGRFRR